MSLCQNSVQIDDFDERIVYSGPWQTFTDQADVSYNGTRHVAPAPGLSANFKFNGSCLVVSGLVGVNGSRPMPPTTFVLDGHFRQINTSDVFFGDKSGVGGTGAAGLVPAMLYAALTISDGPHELIVTSLGGNASAPLVLDGFIVTPTQDDPGSTSSSSPSASSAAEAGSGGSSVSGGAAAGQADPGRASSHSHTGAIVGGVVGGLGGLLLLALLVLLARHWRRRRHAPASEIRPFAAWRGDGGGQPVLPVSVGPAAGLYAEKKRLPMCTVTPTSASVPTGSSTPSEPSAGTVAPPPPPAPAPAVLPPQRWFPRDAKAQPPEYTP